MHTLQFIIGSNERERRLCAFEGGTPANGPEVKDQPESKESKDIQPDAESAQRMNQADERANAAREAVQRGEDARNGAMSIIYDQNGLHYKAGEMGTKQGSKDLQEFRKNEQLYLAARLYDAASTEWSLNPYGTLDFSDKTYRAPADVNRTQNTGKHFLYKQTNVQVVDSEGNVRNTPALLRYCPSAGSPMKGPRGITNPQGEMFQVQILGESDWKEADKGRLIQDLASARVKYFAKPTADEISIPTYQRALANTQVHDILNSPQVNMQQLDRHIAFPNSPSDESLVRLKVFAMNQPAGAQEFTRQQMGAPPAGPGSPTNGPDAGRRPEAGTAANPQAREQLSQLPAEDPEIKKLKDQDQKYDETLKNPNASQFDKMAASIGKILLLIAVIVAQFHRAFGEKPGATSPDSAKNPESGKQPETAPISPEAKLRADLRSELNDPKKKYSDVLGDKKRTLDAASAKRKACETKRPGLEQLIKLATQNRAKELPDLQKQLADLQKQEEAAKKEEADAQAALNMLEKMKTEFDQATTNANEGITKLKGTMRFIENPKLSAFVNSLKVTADADHLSLKIDFDKAAIADVAKFFGVALQEPLLSGSIDSSRPGDFERGMSGFSSIVQAVEKCNTVLTQENGKLRSAFNLNRATKSGNLSPDTFIGMQLMEGKYTVFLGITDIVRNSSPQLDGGKLGTAFDSAAMQAGVAVENTPGGKRVRTDSVDAAQKFSTALQAELSKNPEQFRPWYRRKAI